MTDLVVRKQLSPSKGRAREGKMDASAQHNDLRIGIDHLRRESERQLRDHQREKEDMERNHQHKLKMLELHLKEDMERNHQHNLNILKLQLKSEAEIKLNEKVEELNVEFEKKLDERVDTLISNLKYEMRQKEKDHEYKMMTKEKDHKYKMERKDMELATLKESLARAKAKKSDLRKLSSFLFLLQLVLFRREESCKETSSDSDSSLSARFQW